MKTGQPARRRGVGGGSNAGTAAGASAGADIGSGAGATTGAAQPPLYTRFALVSLLSIDTAAQRWSADLTIEIAMLVKREQWDELAHEAKGDPSPEALMSKLRFSVEFTNDENTGDTKTESWLKSLKDGEQHIKDGLFGENPGCDTDSHMAVRLNLKWRHAVFAQRFDLSNFPFDAQALRFRLRLSSHDKSSSLLRFAGAAATQNVFKKKSSSGDVNRCVVDGRFSGPLSEWRLARRVALVTTLSPENDSSSRVRYSHVTGFVLVKRKWVHMVLNFVAPTLCVLLCACLLPCVDGAGESLSAGSALLLAALTLKNQVSDHTPVLGWPTLLDKFVLVACLLLMLGTVVAVGRDLAGGGDGQDKERFQCFRPGSASNLELRAFSAVAALSVAYFAQLAVRARWYAAARALASPREEARGDYVGDALEPHDLADDGDAWPQPKDFSDPVVA